MWERITKVSWHNSHIEYYQPWKDEYSQTTCRCSVLITRFKSCDGDITEQYKTTGVSSSHSSSGEGYSTMYYE